jgi:threonine dehydratase
MHTEALYHKDLYKYIKKTPIITNDRLNKELGCSLYFKCENLQNTGSFKFRGASNAILSLDENQRKKGVITASSGNHGTAMARVGQIFDTSVVVVVPRNAPVVKIQNIKFYGAEVVLYDGGIDERMKVLNKLIEESGRFYVPAFNYEDVIHGQSTIAKEIFEEVEDIDSIISPISGGGLISGTILSRDIFNSKCSIFGAEPENMDDAYRSLKSGNLEVNSPNTSICDGLLASLGDKTFPIIRDGVEDIFRVSDKDTLTAMKDIWNNLKIIVEPSSAITFAALRNNAELFKGKKVGLILSGGNVTLSENIWTQYE